MRDSRINPKRSFLAGAAMLSLVVTASACGGGQAAAPVTEAPPAAPPAAAPVTPSVEAPIEAPISPSAAAPVIVPKSTEGVAIYDQTYALDVGNTAGLDLVASVKPRIFVPTHIWGDPAMAKAAARAYPDPAKSTKRSIHVDPTNVPARTTVLFSGLNADLYGKRLKLAKADW
jgi:hypothetical protein